jgi:Putative DNA-binding domain
MIFDTKVPSKLKKTQMWFGSIIGRPIDEDSRMNPLSPSGNPMEIEAYDYIKPSPTLRPAQRIQIYNQQYWWRLLNNMHEAFPLVVRLFGYHDFNRTISIPYLVKYPPVHWSLNYLGEKLPQWVQEEYQGEDKQLVYDAVRIDCAFNNCFTAPELEPITAGNLPREGDPSSLFNEELILQPHLYLFEMTYDLFSFRRDFLTQEVEYWVEHDFPPLKKGKKFYIALFRTINQDVGWRGLSQAEFHLLQQFKEGSSLEKACQWIENQEGELFDEASQNLQKWIQDWIVSRWLARPQNSAIESF